MQDVLSRGGFLIERIPNKARLRSPSYNWFLLLTAIAWFEIFALFCTNKMDWFKLTAIFTILRNQQQPCFGVHNLEAKPNDAPSVQTKLPQISNTCLGEESTSWTLRVMFGRLINESQHWTGFRGWRLKVLFLHNYENRSKGILLTYYSTVLWHTCVLKQ